jgi:hypothetical protein
VQIVDNNTLKIEGARKSPATDKMKVSDSTDVSQPASSGEVAAVSPGEVIRQERFSEAFTRSVTFPHQIASDHLRASFHNGLLEITVPKESLDVKQVRIPID